MLALVAELDLPRVVLIGTSMGGLIAMIAAAAKPPLVAAIILSDVGPVVDQAGIARIRDYVGNAPVPRDWADAAAIARATNAQAARPRRRELGAFRPAALPGLAERPARCGL